MAKKRIAFDFFLNNPHDYCFIITDFCFIPKKIHFLILFGPSAWLLSIVVILWPRYHVMKSLPASREQQAASEKAKDY